MILAGVWKGLSVLLARTHDHQAHSLFKESRERARAPRLAQRCVLFMGKNITITPGGLPSALSSLKFPPGKGEGHSGPSSHSLFKRVHRLHVRSAHA